MLLELIDEAFDRQSWHGTNLRGSLRGVSAARAAWRPDPLRHNVWEIVVHAAYWKYAVRRRLTGEKRGSFPMKGSNWFPRPSVGGEQAWREDLKLLVMEHRKMRTAVEQWLQSPQRHDPNKLRLIRGIAAHDLYHAGQIQLLKRLARG